MLQCWGWILPESIRDLDKAVLIPRRITKKSTHTLTSLCLIFVSRFSILDITNHSWCKNVLHPYADKVSYWQQNKRQSAESTSEWPPASRCLGLFIKLRGLERQKRAEKLLYISITLLNMQPNWSWQQQITRERINYSRKIESAWKVYCQQHEAEDNGTFIEVFINWACQCLFTAVDR